MSSDNLIKLIDYIIIEPLEDNFKSAHKYPFNASEILCSENVFVIDKFFEELKTKDKEIEQNKHLKELEDQTQNMKITDDETKKPFAKISYPIIDHFFSFLQINQGLNYVLCGYFYKLFNHLANFRNSQVMKYLFFYKRNFIDDLIKHINRKSICDCINKIILSHLPDSHVQVQQLKLEILSKILTNFDSSDEEVLFILLFS